MPIDLPCSGCGKTLRVAEEHAGKMARCPQCGTIVAVPLGGTPAPPVPAFESPFAASQPATSPFGAPSDNPYASPQAPTGPLPPAKHYLRAHRGGMVLTFGIVGLLCCLPLAIAAWIMGAADLKAIRAGTMDPAGKSMTQVGMILGIVSVILTVVSFVFNVGIAVLGNLR